MDPVAFRMLAGVVLFFAMVTGASAYFFRAKRGAERKDVSVARIRRKSTLNKTRVGHTVLSRK